MDWSGLALEAAAGKPAVRGSACGDGGNRCNDGRHARPRNRGWGATRTRAVDQDELLRSVSSTVRLAGDCYASHGRVPARTSASLRASTTWPRHFHICSRSAGVSSLANDCGNHLPGSGSATCFACGAGGLRGTLASGIWRTTRSHATATLARLGHSSRSSMRGGRWRSCVRRSSPGPRGAPTRSSRFVNHIPGNRAYWKRQSNLLQSFDFFPSGDV